MTPASQAAIAAASPAHSYLLKLLPTLIGTVVGGVISALVARWQLRVQLASQLQHEIRSLTAGFANSHAATVVFDQYVAFCEKYMAAMRVAVDTLAVEGPNRGAMQAADAMHRVRMECSLWVPQDVSAKLFKFEKKIRGIGINAAYTRDGVGVPGVSDIPDRVNQMYKDFAEVLNLRDWPGAEFVEDYAFESVAAWLQDTLGIEVTHALRRASSDHAFHMGA